VFLVYHASQRTSSEKKQQKMEKQDITEAQKILVKIE
jgi:hypothetical protein